MVNAAGPDGMRVCDGEMRAPDGATVLHAWADRYAVGDVEGQVARVIQVRDIGWRIMLALPEVAAWHGLAVGAAEAGLPVVRWSPDARRQGRRWPLTSTAARARWTTKASVAVVHAHDDRAVDQWRPVARRCAVPLIWDVDQRAPRAAVDGRRLAASSYVITVCGGSRLAARRVLPPNQRGAGPRAGEWFDLAEDDDLAARPPTTGAKTVCDVYACLTGQRPAPVVERAGDAITATFAG